MIFEGIFNLTMMTMKSAGTTNFTHLHVHSHFTLLGATASVEDLVQRASEQGFRHLALTDTNALYGAVAFSKACHDAGIKPIIGMTVGLATGEEGLSDSNGDIVLLATGPRGYRSLSRLTSYLQGSPDREALLRRGLRWEKLRDHREGLICLSGGRNGWLERFVRAGDRKSAYRFAGRLAEIFDRNLYLSLELHRFEDEEVASVIDGIGKSLGIPAVAVQPVYYMEPEDVPKLQLLAAIDRNCDIRNLPHDALPMRGDSEVQLHWLSPEDMSVKFSEFPESLEMVGRVARRCSYALPGGDPIWPSLYLPEGESPGEFLAKAAGNGLREKYGPNPDPDVTGRLESELEAINKHGYSPLFIVVADIVRFAKQAGVPVSTRGSVANSLVAYCAGITMVDPIEHDLLFERFLNPARKDLPDIDLDFCSRRRDEVLEYVRSTYGSDKVALVSTVSTLRPRSAVRETAKAYGLEESEINKLASLVPRMRRRGVTLEEVLEKLDEALLREIVEKAFAIVGQPDHLSLHPGGVVITPGPMTDVVPVQWSPKGFLITQYEHWDVEAIGLPKLDLLGIRALTVLADAEELIKEHHDPGFRLEDIPFDDAQTASLLSNGETIGVFQCESFGAVRTLRQLRAHTVRDLAIANAFFRPGPLMGGMAETFVRRFRGDEPVVYLHPSLEPILGNTRGVLIFQEQILRVAREIAGMSWEQADQLRRGISKLRSGDMADVESQFIEGCQRPEPEGHRLSQGQAEELWEQVIAFSGFGFNQGHATAYAHVSYRSAFLKAHWPEAFICARLADRGGYHHPAIYMAEAARLGIRVKPPHVNCSRSRFTLTWEEVEGERLPHLWMGLDQVRDLRRTTIRAIIEERNQEPFQSVRDLVMRVSFQAKELVHLIQSGGLDGLGDNRAALLAEAEGIRASGSEKQMAFSFATPHAPPETRAQTMSWEMKVLGYPISIHPLEVIQDLPDHVPLRLLSEHEGQLVSVVGVRLPGWTGGEGFFLGDGDTFVIARTERGMPQPETWKPLHMSGYWRMEDESVFWFHATRVSALEYQSGNTKL